MFKVLGSYSADYSAQPTANTNYITNERSLFPQKPICFFTYTNYSQVRPNGLTHKSQSSITAQSNYNWQDLKRFL